MFPHKEGRFQVASGSPRFKVCFEELLLTEHFIQRSPDWMIPSIIVAIGSIALAVLLWAIVLAMVRERRLARLPPPPPFRCPHCKSEQIDVLYSGLWDGLDANGNSVGGIKEYGLCKACGGRCARLDAGSASNRESRIPTEEEWDNFVGSLERARRAGANWPFPE